MRQDTIRIHPHVRSIIDPDGAVLLDLKKGKYYSLNGTGTTIWQKLEAGLSMTEIAADLGAGSEVPVEAVRQDVAAFVAGLQQKQLVDVGA